MKFQIELLSTLFCLILLPLTTRPIPQEETKSPENTSPKKPNEKMPNKLTAATIHILLSAENMKDLPDGSSIEMKTDSESCNKASSVASNIHSGTATFADVPACKVKFQIFVTGFNTQSVSTDLLKCKEPIRITLNTNSSPKLTCSNAEEPHVPEKPHVQ